MRDAVGRRKDKDEQILTVAASEKLKEESWSLRALSHFETHLEM